MGFSNMLSQILYAPPKIWGIIPGIIIAWWTDKTHQRAAGIIFNALLVIVGTCMFSQLGNDQKVARYAGIFLSFGACTGNVVSEKNRYPRRRNGWRRRKKKNCH